MKKFTQFGKTKLVIIAILFALLLSCLAGVLVVNNGADAASADTATTVNAVDNEEEEDWSPAINPITWGEVSKGYYRNTGLTANPMPASDFWEMNSSYASASLNGNVVTASKVQESNSYRKYYGLAYITFKAETTIPAYAQYTITYNFTLAHRKYASGSSTSGNYGELLHFGNIDRTSSAKFYYSGNYSAYGIAKVGKSRSGSWGYAYKTLTVTYVNKTGHDVNSTDYFCLWGIATPGSSYASGFTSQVTINSASIVARPVSVDDPVEVKAVYDGEDWYSPSRFESLECDLFYWYTEGIIDLELLDEEVIVEVGKHHLMASLTPKAATYHVKWSDGTQNVKEFVFEVTRRKIAVTDFDLDDDYALENVYTGGILERDKDTVHAPVFGIRYYKDGVDTYFTNPPQDVSTFTAEVYIINFDDSHYQIDTASNYSRKITVVKDNVTAPWIICVTEDSKWDNAESTLTTPYTGEFQTFKLINTNDGELVGIQIADVVGSMTYEGNTLSARNVSDEYTVKLELINPHLFQWYDHEDNLSEFRYVYVQITSAHLSVKVEGGNEARRWNKGECNELTVTVSGVIGADQVKVDLYYTYGKQTIKTYIGANDIAPVNENGEIVANVYLEGLDIGAYTLYVVLRSNVRANERYVIWDKANAKEIDAYAYQFELEETIVVIENFDWKYYIGLNNEEYYDWADGNTIDFTGNEYFFNMFIDGVNAVNVPGLVVEYISYLEEYIPTDDFSNAYKYVTVATVSLQPGYVFPNDETVKQYEVNWEITPISFDVTKLDWDKNLMYSGMSQTMSIVNALSWMDVDYNFSNYYNKRIDSGEYVAKAVIDYNPNCTFYIGGGNGDNDATSLNSGNTNIILNEDGSVTLEHSWSIIKQRLDIATSGKGTLTFRDEHGEKYTVDVPKFIVGKEALFNITFYTDEALSDEITKEEIIVRYGKGCEQILYAKIELTETAAKNFEMYKGTKFMQFDKRSFKVGDNREGVQLTFDFDEVTNVETDEGFAVAFEGAVANFSIKASSMDVPVADFELTYFTYDEDAENGEGSCLDGIPTDAGEYIMEAAFKNDAFNNDYIIKNGVNRLSVKASAAEVEQLKPKPEDPNKSDDPTGNEDPDPNANQGANGNLGGNVIVNGMTDEQFIIMLVSIIASVLFLGTLIIVFMILYSKSRAAKEAAAAQAQTADPEQMAQMQADLAAMRAQMAVGAVGLGVGAAGSVKKVRPRISSNKVMVKFPSKD